jgi:hypothetical protein
MNEFKKLRVLIPHWIEHNEEHAREFRKWSKKTGEISGSILAAADSISEANAHLEAALEKLGGALPYSYLQGESDDNHTS